ncbi:carbamoyltransferase [Hahella aquimaris]|uniref:carbamoyltransferase family protein n=1 Tax=Hahella sp. HNIBRBA332 TaxID=3015983 RepID=UPI00273C3C45|nr:carbamoyltransferase [Hahella sp. HNIBRBA332]WLQ12863.1 carbamoyltransferase [Hahella sp. HNIBRBA332]
MTTILGISAYYHDAAATLVKDGVILAAAQEERFTRKKHDAGFPRHAIEYVLDAGGVALDEVDAVVFYDKPLLKFERLLETYLAFAPRGFRSFATAMPVWLKDKLFLKSELKKALRGLLRDPKAVLPRLLFAEHHQSHAASAFYPSPFANAAVLCLDGVGEWATSSVWVGEGASLRPLWEIEFPHSLGLLYSAFTYFCGFKVNAGEYKLMGLAPYGEPKYVDLIMQHLIDVKPDGTFRLHLRYFDFMTGLRMTNQRFAELFDLPRREPEAPLTQAYMDLARSVQAVTEEIVLRLGRTIAEETGQRHLCLAGGVALNCVANGRLLREGPFDDIWIQPASGDAGGSLGAALLAWHHYQGEPRTRPLASGQLDAMQGAYLGPQYSDEDIQRYLTDAGASFVVLEDDALYADIAGDLADGQVVGWFQGRMEFGPRALGARSILGNPMDPVMQTKMNLKIKFRESFRPFAPAVAAEQCGDYFELEKPSPYMLLVADVKEQWRKSAEPGLQGLERLRQIRSDLPAITHVDYSARVQTVHQETNPEFHRLIKEFAKRSGHPVLINTSFNVRGEPPVCSPDDAFRCFMATEMDVLVLGRCVLRKAMQPEALVKKDWSREFELD